MKQFIYYSLFFIWEDVFSVFLFIHFSFTCIKKVKLELRDSKREPLPNFQIRWSENLNFLKTEVERSERRLKATICLLSEKMVGF